MLESIDAPEEIRVGIHFTKGQIAIVPVESPTIGALWKEPTEGEAAAAMRNKKK